MADGSTAADRLERLLHILPAASVEGGVPLDALADELGVERATVVADLAEVTARSYYHPAGSGDDIQIRIEADRVGVWTTGAFQRPVKLSPMEAFCLALGLRRSAVEGAGAGHGARSGRPGVATVRDRAGRGPRDGHADLLRRVEAHLATGEVPDEPLAGLHAVAVEPDPEGRRELLTTSVRERARCRIRYLKPGEPEPSGRVIHPYGVVHAEGRWYAIAWCETSEGPRAFRLDRVLDAEPAGGRFERRGDVDVDGFLEGGRVFRPDDETEVLVRYSPVVARWIEERVEGAEALADGAVLVRHRVADPAWVVRHVLAYAGEAEVLEPPEVRGMLSGAGRGGSPRP